MNERLIIPRQVIPIARSTTIYIHHLIPSHCYIENIMSSIYKSKTPLLLASLMSAATFLTACQISREPVPEPTLCANYCTR